tara:strand:- start:404 stop:823 length:420 start_codon:yes stop_codon:yes gene_type:complete
MELTIGKKYYSNGELMYEGELKDCQFNGKGKLYYANGVLMYEGELKNNNLNGYGTLYRISGIIMRQGEFKDHIAIIIELNQIKNINEIKKLYWDNGELMYEGEFKDGQVNGLLWCLSSQDKLMLLLIPFLNIIFMLDYI